jgi:tetratricopeptide (TPR) repeat protein
VIPGHADRSERALAACEARQLHGETAGQALAGMLGSSDVAVWLACAQTLVLRQDRRAASVLLQAALSEHPQSADLRVAMAGAWLQDGRHDAAEALLADVLAAEPGHIAAAFTLAGLLREQGRMAAMAAVLVRLIGCHEDDHELLIQVIELLDDCGRQSAAAELCERAIARGSLDPRLHVHAGMLLAQLGQFSLARTRHAFALATAPQALDWNVPLALSELQRYANADHTDLAQFRHLLERPGLADPARASLLFALGKAHDDLADYPQAAAYLQQANQLVHATVRWSRKTWRRSIEARISRRPPTATATVALDWTPVFIVGMPRSGTTLLAERLARHPQVCHRGELAWLPRLAAQLDAPGGDSAPRLAAAAATYAAQLRQDDSDAGWFIDKQPLNFLHVDLILRLYPQARIIHCRRNARDNALSLWMQSFPAGRQDYAYDIGDIGVVLHSSRRLMTHWGNRYPQAIRTVSYEALAADPDACLAGLADWLGLPPHAPLDSASPTASISTASLWQVRQPIHTRSVQRWRHYATHLPGLLQIPEN